MNRIVVLNPKGGSGKSTLATNLASYFAVQGHNPTLMDMDPQGSSMRWLSKRGAGQPQVHVVAGYERKASVTRSFALRSRQDSNVAIVDSPAAIEPHRLSEYTRDAKVILVPVLPSDIDIHAATRCISSLLLVAKVNRNEQHIGVVANRVKRNTIMYRSLMNFLHSLQIPVVTTLRDSQAYLRAFERGLGIFEFKWQLVREDLEQWQPLTGWLDNILSFQRPQQSASPAALARPFIARRTMEMQQTPLPLENTQPITTHPQAVTASHTTPRNECATPFFLLKPND